MTDDELREMVRASIARIAGAAEGHAGGRAQRDHWSQGSQGASFSRLPLVRGGDLDGACLIEPTVRCTHCGYCQSYGH
jgi:hypothetical protein